MEAIHDTHLPGLERLYRGKVRDTYGLPDGELLMIATDRISAFDIVLPTAIPDKGAVLCQISSHWFGKTAHIVPNHMVALAEAGGPNGLPAEIARRAMVVRAAERIDVECIVRGYITGSAWAEYRREGTVSGMAMPSGLKNGDRFPEPLFTPTTKAEVGHDENISIEEVQKLVGEDTARRLEEISIAVYSYARERAFESGIVIADTKMEFGFIDGELSLIDELLTPDSSRFWDAKGYEPGKSLPNFDKQFVRDWLDEQDWDHEPPAPELPDDVVSRTRERYLEAYNRLTGAKLA